MNVNICYVLMFKQNVNKTTTLTGPCESPAVSNTSENVKTFVLKC